MGSGVGIRQVGYYDCAGGGQVVVGTTSPTSAHAGMLRTALRSSTCAIPRTPKSLRPSACRKARTPIRCATATASSSSITRSTSRQAAVPADFRGGFGVTTWRAGEAAPYQAGGKRAAGSGVHRYDFDGRYAYMSPTIEGYVGNIVMIFDFKDPANPVEVGRWWMPGQWTAGGEKPTWDKTAHRCHHPLRLGNRCSRATGSAASSFSTSTT